jgi:hypothetical protein
MTAGQEISLIDLKQALFGILNQVSGDGRSVKNQI